ncbi:MAG: TPM domain-containing protein [Leptospiraceae bacterium]|nr:TPM domain-containing protein [Leptospiraceae bacterium]
MLTLRPLTYFLCKKLSVFLVYFSLLNCFSLLQAQPEVYRELSELPRLKQSRFVYDNTGKILPAELKALQSSVSTLESDTGAEIGIVFLQKLPTGISAKEAATFIFNDQKLGKQGEDNGILILTVLSERRWEIETGYGMEGIFPDALCRRMGERFIVPNFKQENYANGLLLMTIFISEIYRSEKLRSTLSPETENQLQEIQSEVRLDERRTFYLNHIYLLVSLFVLIPGLIHWHNVRKRYKHNVTESSKQGRNFRTETHPDFIIAMWVILTVSVSVFHFFYIWWDLLFLNIAISVHYTFRRLHRDKHLRDRFIYNIDKRNQVLQDIKYSPWLIAAFFPFPAIIYAVYHHWKSNQLYWLRTYTCPECETSLTRANIAEWSTEGHPHHTKFLFLKNNNLLPEAEYLENERAYVCSKCDYWLPELFYLWEKNLTQQKCENCQRPSVYRTRLKMAEQIPGTGDIKYTQMHYEDFFCIACHNVSAKAENTVVKKSRISSGSSSSSSSSSWSSSSSSSSSGGSSGGGGAGGSW